MALSEIEKLERRYAENPQGLTFAPLAEVHRKNGEVQRAARPAGPRACRSIPTTSPPASSWAAATWTWATCTRRKPRSCTCSTLDGENVIALKALADISERLLKFDDAERWLHTLLTVDRSNDDAREQLQRVEIARRQAERGLLGRAVERAAIRRRRSRNRSPSRSRRADPRTSPRPPPPFRAAAAEPRSPAMGVSTDHRGPRAAALRVPRRAPPRDADRAEPVQLRAACDRGADRAARRSGGPRSGHAGRSLAGRRVPASRQPRTSSSRARAAASSRCRTPRRSSSPSVHAGERGPFEEDAPPPSAERKAEPEPELSEPVPGARGVWRRNCRSRVSTSRRRRPPSPCSLTRSSTSRSRSPWSTSRPRPEPVLTALEAVAATRRRRLPLHPPPPALPKRSYGAGDTGGRSINQLFKGILAARPPVQALPRPGAAGAAAGHAGAPTRPAADALSLSSVFGEEGSETPPAVPAAECRVPVPSPSTTSSVPRVPLPPPGRRAPPIPRTTTSTSFTPGSRT